MTVSSNTVAIFGRYLALRVKFFVDDPPLFSDREREAIRKTRATERFEGATVVCLSIIHVLHGIHTFGSYKRFVSGMRHRVSIVYFQRRNVVF